MASILMFWLVFLSHIAVDSEKTSTQKHCTCIFGKFCPEFLQGGLDFSHRVFFGGKSKAVSLCWWFAGDLPLWFPNFLQTSAGSKPVVLQPGFKELFVKNLYFNSSIAVIIFGGVWVRYSLCRSLSSKMSVLAEWFSSKHRTRLAFGIPGDWSSQCACWFCAQMSTSILANDFCNSKRIVW